MHRRAAILNFLVAFIALAQSAASAQSAVTLPPQSPNLPQWQIDAGSHAEFDVASIRPAPPDAPPHDGYEILNNPLLNPYAEDAPPRGLISANASVVNYIIFAYKIYDVNQMHQLSEHLPAWARSDDYVIEARAVGSPTRDQTRLMMQSLLAERFHLALHIETRPLPVYALVLDKPGKPGPQLQPHPANTPCPVPSPDSPDSPPAKPALNSPPPPICGMTTWRVGPLRHIRMINVTMEQIAGLLDGVGTILGDMGQRTLVDQTDLTGRFDLNIEFLPERIGSPSFSTEADSFGPSVTAALKSQLGLRLVKQTAPVNIYVVDHIERPSEN
ncbi:MAG: TIGR03435 family protein [Acidobacteriaceae bacterium]|jgi:uncharacterized protein (TIGR03435 family)